MKYTVAVECDFLDGISFYYVEAEDKKDAVIKGKQALIEDVQECPTNLDEYYVSHVIYGHVEFA